MSDYAHHSNPLRMQIEQAIVERLEAKSTHDYQWSRWSAADEASHAVMPFLVGQSMKPEHTRVIGKRPEGDPHRGQPIRFAVEGESPLRDNLVWTFGRRASVAGSFHAENEGALELMRVVEEEIARARREAWEQGWVARGNEYEASDNPYGPPDWGDGVNDGRGDHSLPSHGADDAPEKSKDQSVGPAPSPTLDAR